MPRPSFLAITRISVHSGRPSRTSNRAAMSGMSPSPVNVRITLRGTIVSPSRAYPAAGRASAVKRPLHSIPVTSPSIGRRLAGTTMPQTRQSVCVPADGAGDPLMAERTEEQRRQQTLEARRAARARFAEDRIRKIVDGAPRLTDEQIAKLLVLLA